MAQKLPKTSEGFTWTPTGGYSRGLSTPAVVPSTSEESLLSRYDVIVIGAGFAGLSAARDLALAGKEILLVEGRDRIGGRAWTAYDDFSGAKFEMDEFEVTHPYAKSGEVHVKRSKDESVQVRGHHTAMPDTADAMAKLLDVDGNGGKSVVSFPFNTRSSVAANPAYMEADKLSVVDRAGQIDVTEEQRKAVVELASSFFGLLGEETSFLELLHMNSLCSFNEALVEEATMRYKISRGASALALAILGDFKGHRMMSSPVTAISQTQDGCKVTLSSGKELFSDKVVSTIPANVALSIQYNPPLSSLSQEALTNGLSAARIDKVLATTSKNLDEGLHVMCEGGDMPCLNGFADGRHQKDQSLITLLAKPDVDLDSCDHNMSLLNSLNPDGLGVTSVRAHLWSKDPFAGGVMACRKPGFVLRYFEEMRKPHGNVFFCGSDWADGWRGFISGAFEDSYRVTREFLRGGNL
ncbi:hypothetical protein BDV25DRAFT_142377 [Aspergillus avenaceus]|uniref:Amine oxidase n=1 Tax=Aspergillus avenaceus TaxID=36643 RepID=A0A5N6TNX4_ASPAV|nr:hypothetical protein BDV25DRAFT_142377 [Aspergillus avenaceus]